MHPIRWDGLKYLLRKEKKSWPTSCYLHSKAESQAIGGRIGKAAEFPSKWRVAGSSLFPVSKAWTRQEDRQGGQTFLWSYCYLSKLFVSEFCFPIRCLLVTVTSLFFAKSSINWTTLQEVRRTTQNGNCPLRVRQPKVFSCVPLMGCSLASQVSFLHRPKNKLSLPQTLSRKWLG